MQTLTVKELIKQLRRHPDHTPVQVGLPGKYKPLLDISEVRLHVFEEKIFIITKHVK